MALVRGGRLQRQAPNRQRPTGGRSARVTGGAYRGSGSEAFVVYLPGVQAARRGPTAIFCHGGGESGAQASPAPASGLIRAFLEAGMPVIAADLGGQYTWGNDDSIDAVDDALAYGAAQYGTRTDRVTFIGMSHGATIMANWASRNMTRVAFLYGLVPCLNIAGFISRPAGAAFAQTVYDAYGGTEAGWLAAAPTHDPVQVGIARNLSALGDRFRVDAEISDIYIATSDYEAFLVNCPNVDFRWHPGVHFNAFMHDHNEVGRWARGMAVTYG